MDLTSLMEREKNGSAHGHWVFMKDGSLLNHKRAVTCQKNGCEECIHAFLISLLLLELSILTGKMEGDIITNIQAMDF